MPTDYASYIGYFSGFRQSGERHAEMYKTDDMIVIAFPTSDAQYVLGLMFPLTRQDWIERMKEAPEEGFRAAIDVGMAHTDVPARLREARLEGPIKGLLGYDIVLRQGSLAPELGGDGGPVRRRDEGEVDGHVPSRVQIFEAVEGRSCRGGGQHFDRFRPGGDAVDFLIFRHKYGKLKQMAELQNNVFHISRYVLQRVSERRSDM